MRKKGAMPPIPCNTINPSPKQAYSFYDFVDVNYYNELNGNIFTCTFQDIPTFSSIYFLICQAFSI